jgi:hypothetical protein
MAAAALFVLASPYVFSTAAAGALSSTASTTLAFVTRQGTIANCRLSGHFSGSLPNSYALFADSTSLRTADGASVPECYGHHTIVVHYRNQFGDWNTVTALGADPSDALNLADLLYESGETADVAYAVHTVTFTNCNGVLNGCTLQVSTAPK